jgi:hypothetical protein
VDNVAQAANLELVLKGYGASYQTKIRQSKVNGRTFVVFLLTPDGPADSNENAQYTLPMQMPLPDDCGDGDERA